MQRLSLRANKQQQQRELRMQTLRKKVVISCLPGRQGCLVPRKERHMSSPIGRSGHGAEPAYRAADEITRTTRAQKDPNGIQECR